MNASRKTKTKTKRKTKNKTNKKTKPKCVAGAGCTTGNLAWVVFAAGPANNGGEWNELVV